MYDFYIDESGGFSSQNYRNPYSTLGVLAVAQQEVSALDSEIEQLKAHYSITGEEIHTRWLEGKYPGQDDIEDFNSLTDDRRIAETDDRYNLHLVDCMGRVAAGEMTEDEYEDQEEAFQGRQPYFHLSLSDRRKLINDLSLLIAKRNTLDVLVDCVNGFACTGASDIELRGRTTIRILFRIGRILEAASGGKESERRGRVCHDGIFPFSKQDYLKDLVAPLLEESLRQRTLAIHGTDFGLDLLSRLDGNLRFVSSRASNGIQVSDMVSFYFRNLLNYKGKDKKETTAGRKKNREILLRISGYSFKVGDAGQLPPTNPDVEKFAMDLVEGRGRAHLALYAVFFHDLKFFILERVKRQYKDKMRAAYSDGRYISLVDEVLDHLAFGIESGGEFLFKKFASPLQSWLKTRRHNDSLREFIYQRTIEHLRRVVSPASQYDQESLSFRDILTIWESHDQCFSSLTDEEQFLVNEIAERGCTIAEIARQQDESEVTVARRFEEADKKYRSCLATRFPKLRDLFIKVTGPHVD